VPVKKTHILYKAGINFYQLTKYLDLLLKTDLLEQVADPFPAFRTTSRGRMLLEIFGTMDQIGSRSSDHVEYMVSNR
jgi:predicted transcriptional regulator